MSFDFKLSRFKRQFEPDFALLLQRYTPNRVKYRVPIDRANHEVRFRYPNFSRVSGLVRVSGFQPIIKPEKPENLAFPGLGTG